MSFGFSIGDFLATGKLIKDIVSCLRNSSVLVFRELESELDGLQRALHEIEHLRSSPSEQANINGLKVAALLCQHQLNQFASRPRKFERLSLANGQRNRKRDALWLCGRKLQWGFTTEEEVIKLGRLLQRMWTVSTCGCLHMALERLRWRQSNRTSTALPYRKGFNKPSSSEQTSKHA